MASRKVDTCGTVFADSTSGGFSGLLNVLLATLEPNDEVLLTDPISVGFIHRVRLAGGVPHLVPYESI